MPEATPTAPDVAVVGGGLVGSLASLLLARGGARVALIERAPAPPAATDWQAPLAQLPIRHVAVSPASHELLQRAGAWNGDAAAYTRMDVWEELGTADLTFAPEDVSRTGPLGWVADHDGLQAALWQQVLHTPAVQPFPGHGVTAIDSSGALTLAPLDASESAAHTVLRPQLVVAADGARSSICELLQVPRQPYPTGHHALATLVRTEHAHGGVARQRFLTTGPLALLPSPDVQVVSIVWSAPAERVAELRELPAAEFAAQLCSASNAVLGEVLEVGARASFPVQQQLAADFAPQPGVLLLGDAARTLHPLAGQGVNLGFEDVARLCALQASGRLFDTGAQRRFAAARRVRSRAMIAAMAALQSSYGQQGALRSWVRNQGVRWVQGSRFVKRMLMEQALGLDAVAYNSARS